MTLFVACLLWVVLVSLLQAWWAFGDSDFSIADALVALAFLALAVDGLQDWRWLIYVSGLPALGSIGCTAAEQVGLYPGGL